MEMVVRSSRDTLKLSFEDVILSVEHSCDFKQCISMFYLTVDLPDCQG